MKKLFQSEIFLKIFFAMLALAVVPALVLGWLAIEAGSQAGDLSTSLSRTALDAKSQEALKLQAVMTADSIAAFLEEREADLADLALLPRTGEAYQSFSRQHTGELWGVESGEEYRRQEPLYMDVAWVGADGLERVKVQDGQVIPEGDLRSVDDPDTSRYPAAGWFADTVSLPDGECYVGHLNGYFLSADAYQAGQRYDGIIRFARPVFSADGALEGVVTLALDYRHLAQFSAHIVPDQSGLAAEPDVSSGSYAYLIDDLGWTMVHPNSTYQVGVDLDGRSLDYVTTVEQIGALPIRLDQIGFLDQNLASIPNLAASGEAGYIQYIWQENEKFVAYAPIPYYGGAYQEPAGFGWIGIAAEVGNFHAAADLVGGAIDQRVRQLMTGILVVLVGGGLVSIPVAAIVARSVASPVQRLIQAAHLVEK
ncbi:MAG TPA: cache domain-containing protein, partial [Anaerolineales bacterium]|nr:cache domain-containing protein [Anaerolineales bacterium]